MNPILLILATLTLSVNLFSQEKEPEKFDVQGHRGCRGLYPENSIPGFLHALDLGVTTLELDVVITKDNKVILSHEPYISGLICLTPEGEEISEETEKELNIYEMDYSEVQSYDCGSKDHPWFPVQKKMKVEKPLLSDMISEVEDYIEKNDLEQVFYNIETKTTPDGDGVNHPEPEEFVRLLIEVIERKGIEDRTIIQSFDVRTLQVINADFKHYKTALLVGEDQVVSRQLGELGFRPDIISPHFSHINPSLTTAEEFKGIEFIPWTVNEVEDMNLMIELGMKSIITDYPDRLLQLMEKNK